MCGTWRGWTANSATVLGARPRDPEACADVLERAAFACRTDPAAAERWVEAELLDELVDCYEALGRVDEAITVMRRALQVGWAGVPDGRCRIAELLMRDGRVQQATEIWEQVRADTPDDVWLYNNAGLEYAAIDDHETALTWLTQGLRLAMATGDPEGLVEQLADLRDESLSELGRREDQLQRDAEEFLANPPPPPGRRHRAPGTAPAAARSATPPAPRCGPRPGPRCQPPPRHRSPRTHRAGRRRSPVAFAWFPATDYPEALRRWPQLTQQGPAKGAADHAAYNLALQRTLTQYADSGFLPAARGRGPGRTVPGLVPTSRAGPGHPRCPVRVRRGTAPPSRPRGGGLAARPEPAVLVRIGPKVQAVLRISRPMTPPATTRYSASAPAFGVVRCRARCAAVRHAPLQYLAGRPPREPSVRNGLPHR